MTQPPPMPAPEPTTTHRLFDHARVAAGYASARPYLHPEVFALVREMLRPAGRFRRALDVGCGTGLSSHALADLAEQVIGIDASLAMLRHARPASSLRHAVATAEAPPFRDASFDLVVACGSIDWVERERFLPRAAELLASGGFLVALDFGDAGRSPEVPELVRWHAEDFAQPFPRPPARDPLITPAEAARYGFEPPARRDFATLVRFDARGYAEFLMTESNVIAAIEYGTHTAAAVLSQLELQLRRLFGDGPRAVAFEGYVQALRRP